MKQATNIRNRNLKVSYKLRYFAPNDEEMKAPVVIDKMTRKECAAIRASLVSRGARNIERFKDGVKIG